MKIGIISGNKNNKIYTNSTTTHQQYQPNIQTCSDVISFSGKIPSIVTPTMEDLINRTKASDILRFNILRLAKYRIPCPVCGHIMLDLEKFNGFESKVMSTTNTGMLLEYIEELQEYLHPVERKMFKMMKNMHTMNPKMTIHEMLKKKLTSSEKRIIQEQSQILNNLSNMSKKLSMKKSLSVQELITETYARILDPRETSRFSRKIFINKLKAALGLIPKQVIEKDGKIKEIKVRYSPLQQEIMEEAVKLPMAYNNEDAFIVKYAKRNYNQANPNQKIVLRMLSNSLATIEHIKAQKLKGDTAPPNLSLECACCNNKKNHDSVFEQIIENPCMILNYPRYMYRLCEIHLMGKVEKSYITQQNKTYKKESLGILDSNLSLIRYPYSKHSKYTVKDSSKNIIEEGKKKKAAKRIKAKHVKKLERTTKNKSRKYCNRR